MNKTITIRLSADERESLNKLSLAQKRSVSDLVRNSVRKYLAVSEFQKLRSEVLPYAVTQGIFTDEDILNKKL
jgi:predicted transcriptional regulator